MRLDRAIDLYDGELARQSKAERTRRDYWFKLVKLADKVENVEDVTPADCAMFVDRWKEKSASTVAHSVSVIKGFMRFCVDQGWIDVNPAERLKRPRKPAPEELDVITVSADDVRRLLNGVETWHETLCLAVLVYMGPRRRAASTLRWRDVDLERETVRFREKGAKVIVKPLPRDLAALFRAAVADAGVPTAANDYVIPMVRKQLRKGERDDRIVWRTVVRVAERVGVITHVHALRAAFAVQFLETHVGDLEALQALMGHRKIETTQVYLRRLNREKAMERVRDLSWGVPRFEASPEKAPSRFELLYAALQAAA